MNGDLSPVEVEAIAEARAAAIVDMLPEQEAVLDCAVSLVDSLVYAVNTLTATVNRQADELDYLRRKVERLEQGKGS